MRSHLFLISALSLSIVCGAMATSQAQSLRGLSSQEDIHLGPILQGGVTLFEDIPGDKQYYVLEFRGENPKHGYSRLFLRAVSLFRLLDIPDNVNLPDSSLRTVRLHQQFFTLGFESPAYFEWTRPFDLEFGSAWGFTMSRLQFKEKDKQVAENAGVAGLIADYPEIPPDSLANRQKSNQAQSNPADQFLGGELGAYVRYYKFYPFVPYGSFRFILGNFWDQNALIKGLEKPQVPNLNDNPAQPVPTPSPTLEKVFQGGFKTGLAAAAGLDLYLFSRGLLGIEYSLWNWDWGIQEDYLHALVFKAGFLF